MWLEHMNRVSLELSEQRCNYSAANEHQRPSALLVFRITKSMHEQVKALVREHFKARGIRVTGKYACVGAC
jgi:hypothetical protein